MASKPNGSATTHQGHGRGPGGGRQYKPTNPRRVLSVRRPTSKVGVYLKTWGSRPTGKV